jgi:hypothetical protein
MAEYCVYFTEAGLRADELLWLNIVFISPKLDCGPVNCYG